MGVNDWRNVETDPPGADHINKTVLIVKELKSGARTICFGSYMSDTYAPISARWIGEWATNNGKGKVLYWMPLPEIPQE